MTTQFVDYAFPVTGAAALRTLPDRLFDIKNVKDFGAVGDGVTDDHAAIMAAYNWTALTAKHTIYFPPGTYYVSEPIDISAPTGVNVLLTGDYGRSTIVGNFNDYVIKKTGAAADKSFVENLFVINNHATGGGVRLGACVGASMRNCNITANKGINNNGDDTGSGGGTSLEFTLSNCQVSPGIHTSGSVGITTVCNGAINNCRIIGYEYGVITWGQQGGHALQGCYFEGNKYAFRPGMRPTLIDETDVGSTLTGCYFKNNHTAIRLYSGAGGTGLSGVRIEADETVTVYGSRPQYGILSTGNGIAASGVIVTGQYEQAAIVVNNSVFVVNYICVEAHNTSTHGGIAWDMSAVTQQTHFTGCNNPTVIYGIADLPVQFGDIVAATWTPGVIWEFGSGTPGSGYVDSWYTNVPLTGGTGTGAVAALIIVAGGVVVFVETTTQYLVAPPIAKYFPGGQGYTVGDVLSANAADLGGSGSGFTLTVSVAQGTATATTANIAIASPNFDHTSNVVIEGVTPSQYNGVYPGAIPIASNSFMYGPVSNPGGNLTVAGTVNMNSVERATNSPAVKEGDTHDVTNSSSATWGASTVAGGSTHAKIRWNGQHWTVVGK